MPRKGNFRTSKTINAVKHEYILDGTSIIAEKWGASGVTHYIEYIYDANGVIGMIYHNTSMSVAEFEYYYFGKNLQGDIVTIYDIYGSIVVKYTYDAWGNVSSNVINANSPALYNGFKYRGYYYDSATDLSVTIGVGFNNSCMFMHLRGNGTVMLVGHFMILCNWLFFSFK